jgi:hypothetical protein
MLLSKYGIESNQRADIIIERINQEEKIITPLAIIECKAPDVMIGDDAISQTLDYASQLSPDYVFITNGIDLISARFDVLQNQYVDIDGIPLYKEMLKGEGIPINSNITKKRYAYEELKNNADYYLGYEFNSNTSIEFLPFITNLWECFLDTTHKMPAKKYELFELIKDYGIRYLSCGNASGGSYQGAYRSFLVKYQEKIRFMNLSFFDYGTSTILTVSVDQDKHKPHNSLQYSIDSNLRKVGENYIFIHSGRISVGKIGSGKVAELKKYIADRYPCILKGGEINLGTIANKKLLYLDDVEVVSFVEKILSYALIRDEYREQLKIKAKL